MFMRTVPQPVQQLNRKQPNRQMFYVAILVKIVHAWYGITMVVYECINVTRLLKRRDSAKPIKEQTSIKPWKLTRHSQE